MALSSPGLKAGSVGLMQNELDALLAWSGFPRSRRLALPERGDDDDADDEGKDTLTLVRLLCLRVGPRVIGDSRPTESRRT